MSSVHTARRRGRTAVKPVNSVALKIVRRRFASAAFHEIGIHERIQMAGHGRHTNIANLVEAFAHEGHACMAFELHGRDLSHFLSRGKLPVEEVKKLTRQLLSGLKAMHEAGVIHTDFKPGNLLYDRAKGIIRLSDMGLSETSLEAGESVATQDYAPPEALTGAPMASPVDIWALGCTVYEMLTGELLFDPWTACVAKYREFGDDDEDEDGMESTAEDLPDPGPSRRELDRAEEKREQLRAGQLIGGKYQLLRRLGQGKFATVWKAVPVHDKPLVMPPKQQVVDEAKSLRAELPPLPERPRWDLYEVAECYEHLLQMHELLGAAPEGLMQGCWNKLFCENGTQLRFAPEITRRPLVSRLSAHLPAHQATAAAQFLSGLLCYEPRQRLTAEEALKLDWLA